jgi:uncharacterized membrane protein
VKKLSEFLVSRVVAGLLIITPIYLAALLLLKAMKSLSRLVRPLAELLPKWLPADRILSLLLVLFVCFLVGLAVQTPKGRTGWARIENSVFRRIPGYEFFRGFTQRLGGEAQDQTWEPALAEIEEALVPAFIVEELKDGRFAVFVPSVPTPFTGAIYILTPDRVHPLNIPLTQAIKVVSQWGSGCRDLIAAMETSKMPSSATRGDGVRTVL